MSIDSSLSRATPVSERLVLGDSKNLELSPVA